MFVKRKNSDRREYQRTLLTRYGIKVGDEVEVLEVRLTKDGTYYKLRSLPGWFDTQLFTGKWKHFKKEK